MKYIYIAFGFIFFALGAIGTTIPILPTVPFLLLASACFAKGSDRINHWFHNTTFYKNHLEKFERNRAMTMKSKLSIMIPVGIILIFCFFRMENIYGRISILVLLAIKYYVFLFKIGTIKE